jgi:hypothetical protein
LSGIFYSVIKRILILNFVTESPNAKKRRVILEAARDDGGRADFVAEGQQADPLSMGCKKMRVRIHVTSVGWGIQRSDTTLCRHSPVAQAQTEPERYKGIISVAYDSQNLDKPTKCKIARHDLNHILTING